MHPEGIQVIGCAETVLETLPDAGPYLAQLLARLALLDPSELDHRAVLLAMDRVFAGAELDETAPVRDRGLYEQSEDVAGDVAADVAAWALFTLLCQVCQADPGELTHRWIAETAAQAVGTASQSRPSKPHRCDEQCVCPACGSAMYYAPPTVLRLVGEHACVKTDCAFSGGEFRALRAAPTSARWTSDFR